MSDWTPELKEKVKKMYLEQEPTPETSMEIVQEIATELGLSANGVRMVLTTEKVYIKKADAPAKGGATKSGEKKEGAKRVSKEDSIAALREAIESKGATVDDDILGKLTGKAAVYFLEILNT